MSHDLFIYSPADKHDSDFSLLESATKSSPLCPFAQGSLGMHAFMFASKPTRSLQAAVRHTPQV